MAAVAGAGDGAGSAAAAEEEGDEEVPAMLREPQGHFVRTLMGAIKNTVQAAQLLPGEAEFEYRCVGRTDVCRTEGQSKGCSGSS